MIASLSGLFAHLEFDQKEKNIVCAFIDPVSFMCRPNENDSVGVFFSNTIENDLIPARHALINMFASVMRLPKKSNHIDTHIFEAQSLKGTIGIGSMYDTPVIFFF